MTPETLATLSRLAAAALAGPLSDAALVGKLCLRLTTAQKATSPSFQLALLAADIAKNTLNALTSEAPPKGAADDRRSAAEPSW